VHRRDIEGFYESLPLPGLRDRLLNTAMLAPRARRVVKEFFDTHCHGSDVGVPRGAAISAVLAEIVMQPYDSAIRSHPGVYRYYRFSDDILIFSHDAPLDIDAVLTGIFPKSFVLNDDKKESVEILSTDKKSKDVMSFEYLGYKFSLLNAGIDAERKRPFSVTIAESKVRKMKSRLILSLKHLKKDNDSHLLMDRIAFLTGNYKVSRSKINVKAPKRRVRAGIYFNYRHCVDGDGSVNLPRNSVVLKELDGFKHSLLFGANSEFSALIKSKLSIIQQRRLRRMAFFHGFNDSIMRRFQPMRILMINRAWAYVR